MNTCILVTSHLNNNDKIQVAHSILDFLTNKNFPIIFSGNYPIPLNVQSKTDYSFYIKENPKTIHNRQLYFNGKSHDDYGYAHLHQIGKGFLLCQALGYGYVHHLNYDVVFTEENFSKLVKKGESKDPIVYGWGPSNGFATNCFSFKTQDYLNNVNNHLHFYKNENPPGIDNGWFAEIFFKWALNYSGVNLPITSDIKYKTAIHSW